MEKEFIGGFECFWYAHYLCMGSLVLSASFAWPRYPFPAACESKNLSDLQEYRRENFSGASPSLALVG